MTETRPTYAGFLGTWVLDPRSCVYEQGDAPTHGRYVIEDRAGRLHFSIDWSDADGETHHVEFSGVPNGPREPFDGGGLADALSVVAPSTRELTSSAYFKGRQIMLAQRQLDDTGTAMRVTQLVRLPDGSSPANVSVYRKSQPN